MAIEPNIKFPFEPELLKSDNKEDLVRSMELLVRRLNDAYRAVAIEMNTKVTDPISTANDIEITITTKGLILKSPAGTRYRITVDDAGSLITTVV